MARFTKSLKEQNLEVVPVDTKLVEVIFVQCNTSFSGKNANKCKNLTSYEKQQESLDFLTTTSKANF